MNQRLENRTIKEKINHLDSYKKATKAKKLEMIKKAYNANNKSYSKRN